MLSNYPDGVSGNEFEIAGPDYEETEHVECDSDSVPSVPVFLIVQWASHVEALADRGLINTESIIEQLWELGAQVGRATDEDGHCTFEGDADVIGFQGARWWTCPACETEHEKDQHDN